MGTMDTKSTGIFDASGRCVQVSASLIEQHSKCEKQAYHVHVERAPKRPALFFAKGNAIDEAVTAGFTEKQHRKEIKSKEITEIAVARFDKEVKEAMDSGGFGEDEDGEGVPYARDAVVRTAAPFWEDQFKPLRPHPDFDPQQGLEAKLRSGLTIVGTVDVITEDERGLAFMRDCKTAKKKSPPGKRESSVQHKVYTVLYKAATGKPPDGFVYHECAFNEKTATFTAIPAKIDAPSVASIPSLAQAVADRMTALKQGASPIPTGFLSGNFMCRARLCAFADKCRAQGYAIQD